MSRIHDCDESTPVADRLWDERDWFQRIGRMDEEDLRHHVARGERLKAHGSRSLRHAPWAAAELARREAL